MTCRFRFEHNGKRYEVFGAYGDSVNEGFSVTTFSDGALRTLRSASSDLPSGSKIEHFITASSQPELFLKLQTFYAGMKDFSES